MFVGSYANAAVISDTDFLAGNWTAQDLFANNGAAGTAVQMIAGGNPDAYRFMTHTMPGPVSLMVPATNLWIYHEFQGASYDPSVSGAIASVNYSEDQRQFNPPFAGAAIGARAAIEQAGVVYVSSTHINYNHVGSWQTAVLPGLAAADFIDFASFGFAGGDDMFDNPDFSPTGSVIRFGFVRANTTGTVGVLQVTEHGIDNWSYTTNAARVPEPATLTLFGLGLLGLGVVRRRKRNTA
ncbi:MAG: PEP-CTERM sorting domain-containing protein [Alphaproteobacteria bacterium]|nr:PEP-CTERM sorting domain-containing protein [Alphaproteobacteria bacterium]